MPTLMKIAALKADSSPHTVSIQLKTHRTFPDNRQDSIQIKNLFREAENKLLSQFSKREVSGLIEIMDRVQDEIDVNYNLDSMYVFLSENSEEIIRSPWPVAEDRVHVGHSFRTDELLESLSHNKEYLILLLSQGGVSLFEALNEGISAEVRNSDFPFTENPHYITDAEKASDAKQRDNMVREYFNKVDKALNNVCSDSGLPVVVIATEKNYSRLLQVADNSEIYVGYSPVNYNQVDRHQLGEQAWERIKHLELPQ